ncbi:glutamine--tRNA (Gln) amidotransferase subunit A [Parastagonospora nodorum]|uniref:Glutamyl-tRNA(Gln) amidotransferase subunit A, mitochondrial n=1 Tax=Phaeosphaeria nodorum (strain SN15 / ATCC MYA-4574 / FGSC 10173) TaxID=321614 RepID=A0A7U2ERV4_PHANO|nr:glutamine--tRNA (Gln) amidotransferase subunit A [Parastagonospora nodorum]QRC91946.1 glutamine--tRNA (Gln) amidotransferase subunit A [Parastagonospora nodorum SN15]KAH3930650.1 glutamine--tRNA (Gln) amidotransferase subunit A [Parastagonospora nodorum]KAH3968155.1 glutamine--tRNA (Gln) amidotransferase subunit A [Parastagonospora nodorum]KAH4074088.1 glutamine--tRNA (Gln) amidotransferase subunit A [Parastagonospora nodorum]
MSLIKYAKTYIANQAKYAHLNAFVSRVEPSALLNVPPNPPLATDGEGNADWHNLRGMPVAVKDNICTKDLKTTAASGILKDFTSPYDATVVKLLREEDVVVVGKTNMDEFGMGSHSINSHTGPVKMQRYDGEEASAGGSSGGSALAVASSQCWAALGTDTGGSVRLPAAYTGVVGFKPSYGLLSRWGVIAYANSLDTVGILAKSPRNAERVFEKLNVYDPQDPTSLPPSTRSRLGSNKSVPESLRIGIPLDYNIATLHPVVRNTWMRALRALAEKGHTLHPVRLPATQHALSAYYVLAPAEASSNLAKYDGVRFGSRADGIDGTPESVLFAKTRGQGFGAEVQRRILLGAFSLSAQAIDNYFIQAQKVRRLVQQDFNNVFAKANPLGNEGTTSGGADEKVDVLLCPTAPTLAPALSDVKQQDPLKAYMNDVFTVPASLAGLPAISLPVHITKEEELVLHGDQDIRESAGMQIIGQYGDDKLVLNAAQSLQLALKAIQVTAKPDMTAWGHSSLGKTSARERKKYEENANELGLSMAEAIPIIEARKLQAAKQLTATFYEALGSARLNEAGSFHRQSRQEYIARFIDEEDPLLAEKLLYAKQIEYLKRMEDRREGQERLARRYQREADMFNASEAIKAEDAEPPKANDTGRPANQQHESKPLHPLGSSFYRNGVAIKNWRRATFKGADIDLKRDAGKLYTNSPPPPGLEVKKDVNFWLLKPKEPPPNLPPPPELEVKKDIYVWRLQPKESPSGRRRTKAKKQAGPSIEELQ